MRVNLSNRPDRVVYIEHEGRGAEVVLYTDVTETEDGFEAEMHRIDACDMTREEVERSFRELIEEPATVDQRIADIEDAIIELASIIEEVSNG